jgi:hypothetical protein
VDLLGRCLNRGEELVRSQRLASVADVEPKPVAPPRGARRLAEPDVQRRLIELHESGESVYALREQFRINRQTCRRS